ncbi:hypothetical protein EMCG_00158 [[Emmonsia] crescens]|uniref:Uncharacterized protein n=1 Tax=[Emmonsia] crescens TaxID=73230 RepID=A0A0G2J7D2_9EURO|nr:hypothetical protein EMCG_00158 [Emmonsia crescens UAMH 3008]
MPFANHKLNSTFRGSGLSCYNNGWSVNGNYPSIWEATTKYCNRYKGRDLRTKGFPPVEVVSLKTPEGRPFKVNLHMLANSRSARIWDSKTCIRLFQDIIAGCEVLKGHPVGRFTGGAAHTKPWKWSVGIDCDLSSCPRW